MTDEYYDIDFRQKHPTVKGYWVQADKFNEMYRKATALDKIRAEIERIVDEEQKYDEKWAIGLRYAVKIIDNFMEDKE